MKKYFLFFLVNFLTFLAVAFSWGSPFIFSDGYGYYHIGKSLVSNGDLLTYQKPEYYEYTAHAATEHNGKYVTVYAPGNAIYWAPFLFVSNQFDSSTIYNDYTKAFNGHSLADGIAIQAAGAFYLALSIVVILKILEELGFRKRSGYFLTQAFIISSFTFAYVFINGSMSHVYELFSLSLLIFTLLKTKSTKLRRYIALAGFAAGMLVLCRPFNIILLLPVLFYVYKYLGKRISVYFVISAIPLALIYLYYNYVSYGSIFANGYWVLWGQNLTFTPQNIFYLLFSDVRGLFFYTPLELLALWGLLRFAKNSVERKILFIAPIILYFAVYSLWANWWAGDSIAQRFFIVLVPLFIIGLADLIKNPPKKLLTRNGITALIILLTLYSGSVLFLYRITPTAILGKDNQFTQNLYPYIPENERYTPYDIIRYHTTAITEGGSVSEYLKTLTQSLNGGRSLLMLKLGLTDPLAKIEYINDSEFNLHIIPSTNNRKEFVDIEVSTKYFAQENSLKLIDIDSSSYRTIKFICNKGCLPENWSYISISEKDNSTHFIHFSDELQIALTSNDAIKFVDYKLKR